MQSWVDREMGMDLEGTDVGVNIIKIHYTQFSKD